MHIMMISIARQKAAIVALVFVSTGPSQMAHSSPDKVPSAKSPAPRPAPANSTSSTHVYACPRPVPADSLQAAIMASNRGDFKGALAIMNKLVAKEPSSCEIYINRCSVYLDLKDLKNAQNDINKAFDLMELPENKKSISLNIRAAGLLNRGCLKVELGKENEAHADLLESIRMNPSLVKGHCALAKLYKKQGKNDLALESYRTASGICWQFGQFSAAKEADEEIAKLESVKTQKK